MRFGNDDERFSFATDETAKKVTVKLWGFWTAATAGSLRRP